MHLQTFKNMLPCGGKILYKNLPKRKMTIEVSIKTAGTPKASG